MNRPWSPAYERAVSPHRQPSPPPAASPPAAAAVAFAAEHPEDAYCPACNIYLASTVDPTEHLRRCLDDVAGATVLTCPVCDADIGGLRQIERERHIDSCCMTGGETNDKGKERARAYLCRSSEVFSRTFVHGALIWPSRCALISQRSKRTTRLCLVMRPRANHWRRVFLSRVRSVHLLTAVIVLVWRVHGRFRHWSRSGSAVMLLRLSRVLHG